MVSLSGTTPSFGERYLVERELGRGGMATVYLCTDTKFDRRVAIKILHPEMGAAVGAERFHREIRIATGLTHPNILPAFDSGQTADGQLFYVMPYVEGESLRARLQRERQLPVEDAVRITAQVAGALQHAHSHQIVHRDIKPENILLQGDQAIVADFGVARAVTSAADTEALTQTGMSVGTPTYMSPEQGVGEKHIDGRADQYALACVTYEMLTGQPPFTASTMQMLVMKHVGEQAPLITTVRPSVPEELEDVILRALEKVPADRWPTVGDYGEALTAMSAATGTWRRTGMRTGTRTAQMRTTRRNVAAPVRPTRQVAIAGASVFALLIMTATAWAWRSAASRGTGLDLSRVAVTYFDVAGGPTGPLGVQLRDVADGFTESLIERLASVPALDVVSRNGVLPYRAADVPVDSIGRALHAGSIVSGTIEPTPKGASITVQLHDGSGALIQRKAFEFDTSRTSFAAAQDSLTEQVSTLLRDAIGRDLEVRQLRRATASTDAWLLAQRAEGRLKAADSLLLAAKQPDALRALDMADSLSRLAATADTRWPEPHVLRASAALSRAQALAGDPLRVASVIDAGLAQADSALGLDDRSADALEWKGKLLYLRITAKVVKDPRESDMVLARAESALVRSTSINKHQAGAWDALSALQYRKPDLQAAIFAAEKAYDADAYLRSARPILMRLFLASYNLELFPEAGRKLLEFQRRFPTDPFGVEARLLLYRGKGQMVDVDSAWTYLDEYVRRQPEATRVFSRKKGEILVAGAIARAASAAGSKTLADSARHVLLRARVADATLDPKRDLVANEASVRVMLGDYDEAVDLLKDYITVNPDHRRGFANRTGWWWRDLQTYPRFKSLIAGL